MKAILVIDMPRGCNECNCAIDLCHGTLPPEKYYNKRPDWCPLKPMPEKLDFSNAPSGFNWDVIDGWNWCLEEILGETE